MNLPISKFLNFKNIFFEFLAIKKNEDAKYPLILGFLKIFSESLLKGSSLKIKSLVNFCNFRAFSSEFDDCKYNFLISAI